MKIQNSSRSFNKKYQKDIACSYGYKLLCVDDKLSQSFKSSFGKSSMCNFISNMITQTKYCRECAEKKF